MCGRVTLTKTGIRDIADELEAELAEDAERLYRPRYNGAPSETHWIVERAGGPGGHRLLLPAVWGYLASGRPLINVRGEQVGSGGGFRHAFADRRCAVVTDGFYEWTKDHRPFWFHRPDGGLVLLAGLFQPPPDVAAGAAPVVRASAADPAAATRQRFTILTTRPNRVVAAVHDRMPVVLSPDHLDEWLAAPDPARAVRLIAPAAEDVLTATAVSRRVSSVKNDDPECLTPASEGEAQRGEQRSLF